jgi:hypothetical protein
MEIIGMYRNQHIIGVETYDRLYSILGLDWEFKPFVYTMGCVFVSLEYIGILCDRSTYKLNGKHDSLHGHDICRFLIDIHFELNN